MARIKELKTGGRFRIVFENHNDGYIFIQVTHTASGNSSGGWIRYGSGYRAVKNAMMFHANIAYDLSRP